MQFLFLVPETGVEPARDYSHGILSPGRLPIPPLRRSQYYTILRCFRQPPERAPMHRPPHRAAGFIFYFVAQVPVASQVR